MKILFIDGSQGFYPDRLSEKPTGGILTSLTLIPKYLQSKGHEIFIYSGYDKEANIDGIVYTHELKEIVPDVVVFNRNVINNNLVEHFKAVKKIWWLHDIVDHRYLEDDGFRKADKIVALSEYNVKSYSDFYDIPINKFHIIGNGVDKSIFYQNGTQRDKNLYIMASAPVKGMYPVAFAFYNLKGFNPHFELKMYCNQSLHDFKNDALQQQQLDHLKDAGVTICDPIPQKELAKEMQKAWAVLMPNHYPEICSNILLQSLSCGTPVVASNIGSVPEYIIHGENGLLTSTYPHDMYWWWKDFTVQCIAMQNDEVHKKLINKSNIPSWSDIGEQWHKLIED